jgi:hypothetical protein
VAGKDGGNKTVFMPSLGTSESTHRGGNGVGGEGGDNSVVIPNPDRPSGDRGVTDSGERRRPGESVKPVRVRGGNARPMSFRARASLLATRAGSVMLLESESDCDPDPVLEPDGGTKFPESAFRCSCAPNKEKRSWTLNEAHRRSKTIWSTSSGGNGSG